MQALWTLIPLSYTGVCAIAYVAFGHDSSLSLDLILLVLTLLAESPAPQHDDLDTAE